MIWVAAMSMQVSPAVRLYRRMARPFQVAVRGHSFHARYQADTLFEALVLARAIKRAWPHARVHVCRLGAVARGERRWVA